MTRRASLPGASELFRTTGSPAPVPAAPEPNPGPAQKAAGSAAGQAVAKPAAPSGRERHDEKITVYCSPAELVAIETARLQLRAEHGLAADRGRLVREALAIVLADLEANGAESVLVRRLRGE
jgi:phage tail protein X